MLKVDKQYFKRFTWLTPYQLRDLLIETLIVKDLTTENIQQLKCLALDEQARRKIDSNFTECPRCKGYHGELSNNDNLCEKCEQIVHIFQYDYERR